MLPKLQACGFSSLEEFNLYFLEQACCSDPSEMQYFAALGSGNCDLEVGLAKALRGRGVENFVFHCLELNPAMVERGLQLAAEQQVASHVLCQVTDVESWRPDRAYAACLAVHSLHHLVDLEAVFAAVREALGDDGVFLVNDMIGRNGHQRWPEALAPLEDIWRRMPREYKFNHLLQRWEDQFVNWDCSVSGNEGVRAQDILPLLVDSFQFEVFVAFGNVIDVFVDRCFGRNFDPKHPRDLAWIDYVAEFDERLIDAGQVKPTHLIAAARAREIANPIVYRHWSPKFCLRIPD
ncbi:MAG: class I SAM-dependent methyltransferase [Thermoanaerobaculia bacterium]|nr:class I SAM-dependent methyltransferase [Thermoanaerobaculia bacterium]